MMPASTIRFKAVQDMTGFQNMVGVQNFEPLPYFEPPAGILNPTAERHTFHPENLNNLSQKKAALRQPLS
jgi:hypothetical protein